ncbi:MAG: hypothetical protein AB7P52_05795 [Alphaproteobacteria bacterium]
MKQPISNLSLAALLVTDGVVLMLVGWVISRLVDPPGAALIGFILLVWNLAVAFFVVRRGRGRQAR